jgi:hypothetical protein
LLWKTLLGISGKAWAGPLAWHSALRPPQRPSADELVELLEDWIFLAG